MAAGRRANRIRAAGVVGRVKKRTSGREMCSEQRLREKGARGEESLRESHSAIPPRRARSPTNAGNGN